MILVLALAAGLWGLGAALGMPRPARGLLILLLYVGVLAALVVLPAGSPLRDMLGGDLGEWALLGILGLAVWAYTLVLRRVRARARAGQGGGATPVPAEAGPLRGAELERYARHIVLRELGGPGQNRLRAARVLVIGAGGLGSPVLQYLGAAGVGTLGVIDDDRVSASNLQRQVIHTDDRIGMPKVFSAQQAIAALNPYVTVRPYNRRLEADMADALFADYDLVLDGSDNFATRRLANVAAVRAGVPLISGAITQWEGQLTIYDPARGAPCLHCLFPEDPAPGLAPPCAEAGVAGPLPGILGSMMAMDAVKVLADIGAPLRGEMLLYDGLWGETRKIAVRRRAGCEVCGGA